jgi:SAM-dependent methyltransferase
MSQVQGCEPTTRAALSPLAALSELYRQQLVLDPDDPYLLAHADPLVVRTQAAVVDWYSRYLPPRGWVLDWGCRHAPDSCLLQSRTGFRLHVDGCDFVPPGEYSAFHEFAQLDYTQLTDVVQLPYESESFDAVIASGTLEHVAMDYESLKELYRVLKPNGRLIVTYLPNRLSVSEWYRRRILASGHHRRVYGLGELTALLKRTGFYPLVGGYQTRLDMLPDRTLKHQLLRLLCWVVPLHRFTSTMCAVAEKVHGM